MKKKETMTDKQIRAVRKELDKINRRLAAQPRVVYAAMRKKWGIR